ncbi:GTPase-activator protein for Ras family GTPase [Pelomyxa schiedti]|nr:GTPase-activator protein for Ras family GTPase [Pelomyxa schiedti]
MLLTAGLSRSQTTQCNDDCSVCGGYTPTAAPTTSATWAVAKGSTKMNVTFSVYYTGFGIKCQPNGTKLSTVAQFKIEYSRGSPTLAYLNGTATTKALDLYGHRSVVKQLSSGVYWWHAAPMPMKLIGCTDLVPANSIIKFSCPYPSYIWSISYAYGFKTTPPTCSTPKSGPSYCGSISSAISTACVDPKNTSCSYKLVDTGPCHANEFKHVFISYRCSGYQIPASDTIQSFCILAYPSAPGISSPTSGSVLFTRTLLLKWTVPKTITPCPSYKILYDVSYSFVTKSGNTTRTQKGVNTTSLLVSFSSDGVCFWNVTAVVYQGSAQTSTSSSMWNFTLTSPQPPNPPRQIYPKDGVYQPENPPLLKWGMMDGPSCPAGFSLFWPNLTSPVYCYKFVFEPRTWSSANHSCHSYGVDVTLASFLSAEELTFVKSSITYNGTFWIGLHDIQPEGSFSWLDGASVTYLPPGGVKGFNNDSYDCVSASTFDSDWYVGSCSKSMFFICKQTGFNLNVPAYQSWSVYLGTAGSTPALIASGLQYPWYQHNIPLQDGVYNWYVVANNTQYQTQSISTFNFTYCTPSPPWPFSLLTPTPGQVFSLLNMSTCNVTLTWAIPTFMGQSCPGTDGFYHIYLDDTFLGTTLGNQLSVVVATSNHTWYVTADNSALQRNSSKESFLVCTSMPEGTPSLISPLTGDIFIIGESLQWAPVSFGYNCLPSVKVLMLWYSRNISTYNDTRAWLSLPSSNATFYSPSDLSGGTFYWAVKASNSMLSPVSYVQNVTACSYQKPSEPLLSPESPYETTWSNVTLEWQIASCGESCATPPLCNVTVIFNGTVVWATAPTTGSFTVSNLTAGDLWWYVYVNNGHLENVGVGSVSYTPPAPPITNTTVAVNKTVSVNSTVTVNTTVPLNTTVTVNSTVAMNSTVSVNHTVVINATVSVNSTVTVNKTKTVNTTVAVNVTHTTWELVPVNCTENVTISVNCSDGSQKSVLCASNGTISINCTMVIVTRENVTVTANITVAENSTILTNSTIQVNKTVTVNETVTKNVTVIVNQTVTINTTVPVNQTVVVNTTVPVNQTVVVNGTLPVLCNCTPPDVPILSTPVNGSYFLSTQVTLEWGSTYKSFGKTCNASNLKQFIVEWRQDGSQHWNSSISYGKTITNDFAPASWWWHVIANNGVLNSTSEDRLFLTCLTSTPKPPQNLAPAGLVLGALPVTISWESPTDWGISCKQAQFFSLIFNGVSLSFSSQTMQFVSSVTVGTLNNVSVAACTMTKCSPRIYSAFTYCVPSELNEAPNPLEPATGEMVQNNAPIFSWKAPSLGIVCTNSHSSFVVFVLGNSKTSEVVLNTTFSINTTSYVLATPLPDLSVEYYWSVQYFNGEKYTPAALSTFSTCSHQPPTLPVLQYPCNGCTLDYTSVIEVGWSQPSCGITCPYNKPCKTILFLNNGTVTLTALPPSTSYTVFPSFETVEGNVVLSPGNWSWRIAVNNTEIHVQTIPSVFFLCKSQQPSPPTPLFPPSGSAFSQLYVYFNWTVPAFGKSCLSESENVMTFMLMKLGSDYLSATTLSVPFTSLRLEEGSYEWWLTSSNGGMESEESAHFSFSLCIPKAPGYPALVFPLEGEMVPLDSPVVITSLYDWGTECHNNGPRTYKLFITEQTSSWPSVETDLISHEDNMPVHLEFNAGNWSLDQTYYWRVRVTNTEPIQATTDYFRFTACVPWSPVAPTLLFPVDAFNVSYSEKILFAWSTIATWGHICPSDGYSLTLQFILMAEIENSTNTWSVIQNASVLPSATSTLAPVASGTNYSWFLVMSNGWESVITQIAFFGTTKDPCSKILCVRGTCVAYSNGTVDCLCYPNWHGDSCDKMDSDAKEGKKNMRLLGLVAVPGLLVPALLGAAVFVLYRRKRQARLRLQYSKISRLRFCEVKRLYEDDTLLESHKDAVRETLLREAEDGSWTTLKSVIRSTDITQLDNLAKSAVYFFERHGKGLDMMQFLITDEVRNCKEAIALFRANSFSTKAYKFYSKMVGLSYLFQTLGVLFEDIWREAANEEEMGSITNGSVEMIQTSYEVNPETMTEEVDESVNALAVKLVCTKFLIQVALSANRVPLSLRQICATIQKEVSSTLPEYTRQSLGAFFFLRFINTAISVPEGYGLLPETPPENIRRQLIVISKILQNLANGVKFGDKEQFMMKFNDFLEDNAAKLLKFYEQLCSPGPGTVEPIEVPDDYYEPALLVLAYHMDSKAKL